MYDPLDYQLTIDDLPTWMRPQYRGMDWALLFVLIIWGALMFPLATRSGLPPAPDAEMQMYRILEIRDSLLDGTFYPRWATHLNYEYGSPLFNHLAPLPHYGGGLYSALIGDDPQIAVKVEIIVTTLIMIISFFSFLRHRWGDLAAIIGSITLLASPYFLLTQPYLRTDLGALWSYALFCTTLWATDRVLQYERGRHVLILAFSSASLLIADTGLSPMLFGALVGWAIIQSVAHKTFYRRLFLGLLSGALLSSFYYIPAIFEIGAVRWTSVLSYPTAYRVDTLFQSPPPLDQRAFNYVPNLYLGIGTWLLALLGIVAWFFSVFIPKWRTQNTSSDQFAIAFFLIAGGIAFVMILGYEKPLSIWSHNIDPITPMDWGGVLLISLSVIVTQVVVLLERQFSSMLRLAIAISILIGILVASSATSLYIPRFNEINTPANINQHLNDEARGDVMGTFREGYLLPSTAPLVPVPPSELPRDVQSLPPNTRVTQRSLTHTLYEIPSAEPQLFTIKDFVYSGWEVRLNGKIIQPQNINGLITLQLERGLNRVEVRFRTTKARQWGWYISISALVMLLFYALYEERVKRILPQKLIYPPNWLKRKRQQQYLSAFIMVIFAGAIIFLRFSPDLISRKTASDSVPAHINALDLLVVGIRQNGVSLLGYELERTQFAPEDTALLTLYWQANGQRVDPYQVKLTLIKDGMRVKSVLYKHMSIWPTRRWTTDTYTIGTFEIPMPSDPATYFLMIELGLPLCEQNQLLACEQMQLADVYDLRGPTGQQIILPQPMIVYN
ncbi:MAG: hypothetical protein CUN55_06530 [Phototrophicales bacterium]|nr:MAG: hypothetical protein CUN55_06530 [Phototrophicales bacterium]